MKTAAQAAKVPVEDRIARTRAAGDCYFQAWVANDLERILSQHTQDSSFVLHGADGVQRWQGIDQVRQVFDLLIRAWPDTVYDVKSLVVHEEFLVAHSIISATLAIPWHMAGRNYVPDGKKIQFEIVDIWHFEGEKIRSKEGWVDAMALHNKLKPAPA